MKYRVEPHNLQQAWTASAAINLELAPKPYTITQMAVVVRGSFTTTSGMVWRNDPFDRIITRLSLAGGGKTYFDFSNLRAAYHMTRLAGHGTRRPQRIANGITAGEQWFVYLFHFGLAPKRVNPITGMLETNPFDLSAGIPPSSSGNLTLTGTFSAATAVMADTAVTIDDADLEVYLWGVQPESGDPVSATMPAAIPIWSMQTPALSATSTFLGTQHNIPAGDFLHSMLVMTTNDTTTTSNRDDAVLNSLELYNSLESRSIIRLGVSGGNAVDVKGGEIVSQLFASENPYPSDDVSSIMTANTGTAGTITVNGGPDDSGLFWLPVNQFVKNPYGVDLRGVATGDLQLRYGVADATNAALDILYRKYQML